ncbi:Zn-dependent exopeptidase [Mycena filopes]|nr:Zn-dependent exopeptidase [Mycena filopes]
MSKDPEKNKPQDEQDEEGQRRRSWLRQVLGRVVPILALVFFVRVVQVYRAHQEFIAVHYHQHHHGPEGAPAREWRHQKPEPRLTMEEREKLFLSIPNGESAQASAREFTAHAHPAGSAQDAKDALRMLEKQFYPAGSKQSRRATLGLTSALHGPRGPTAWVDVYYPVMDTGREQRLQILGGDGHAVWEAPLVEDGDPLDPDAYNNRNAVPTWHGASGDGDVQGQLIYANYGTQADSLLGLCRARCLPGLNFTGKIVITRYGSVLRGLKIKGAEDLGAVGVLMYSDPRDDGHITVENGFESYPAGPARNPTAVERGSPEIPPRPASPHTRTATAQRAATVRGSPPSPYRGVTRSGCSPKSSLLLPGGARTLTGRASASSVRLVNHVDRRVMPIWNAMAAIPGHVRDEVVVVGCHRDGWVLGASDPISGTASLQEVVRGYGALLKAGWKPLRTIVFASWDAEEYGLIGSTEYGEDFADWLAAHAVAYVNMDASVSGSRFNAAASPSLSHLLLQTARDVPHPTVANKTLFDARYDHGPISIEDAPADAEYLRRGPGLLPPLGSGSDFTVFLQRLGIASTMQDFGGTPQDAVYHYHSIYDSQRWQELHARSWIPSGGYRTAIAQHVGLMLLRLTDSIIVPLNTTQYTLELHNYLDEWASDTLHPARLWRRAAQLAPGGMHVPAAWEEYLDAQFFAGRAEHGEYGEVETETETPHLPRVPPIFRFIRAAKRVTKVNKKLAAFERGFLSEGGIKGREWYKHMVVAPGRWLGYGATTLPALNEALAIDRDAALAKEEADQLVLLFTKLTQELRA